MRRHALWTFTATLAGVVASTAGARAQSPMDSIALAIESHAASEGSCYYDDVVPSALAKADTMLAGSYPQEWAVAKQRASLGKQRYENLVGALPSSGRTPCNVHAGAVSYGLAHTLSIVGFDPALLQEMDRLQNGGRPLDANDAKRNESAEPARADASSLDTSRELENVRLYFQARGGPTLLQAQALLAAYGTYNGTPVGRWGPETTDAFDMVLETYLAIGGRDEDWGVNRPEHTSRLLEWVGQAMFANANGTEYPD